MAPTTLDAEMTSRGYVILRQVIDRSEVARSRALLTAEFKKHPTRKRMLSPSESLQIRELYMVPLRARIVEALKQLCGEDYTMVPDVTVQRNHFGYTNGGWHTDAGCEGYARYLVQPDCRWLKCGIYLQDNTADWGGGIDVVPGGHKLPLGSWHHPVNFKLKSALDALRRPLFSRSVDIKAGDFVCFDSRLPHASTWARRADAGSIVSDQMEGLPEDKVKFVIYWNAGRRKWWPEFVKTSQRRAACEELTEKPTGEFFYSDYLRLKFPDDLPPDLVAAATSTGITIGSVERSAAEDWERRYQEARHLLAASTGSR